MMIGPRTKSLLVLCCLAYGSQLQAESAQTDQASAAEEASSAEWSLGAGLVGFHAPHYLGASQHRTFALPIPYFVYRGKYIEADRNGVRGIIYDGNRVDIRIGGGGALPVNSEDNNAREGMEDLDFVIELGPTIQYQLLETDNYFLRFDVPIRGAFSLGSEFLKHQGWTANPRLHYETKVNEWDLTSTLGLVYGDRRYHGYVYDVDAADVQVDRPFYQSTSGLTATRFTTGIRRHFGNYTVGALFSYYNLNNAANEDSPLVKQNDYASISVIFAWVFGKSGSTSQK